MEVQYGSAQAHARDYFALLEPRLSAARQVFYFRYEQPCWPCRAASLTLADLPPFHARALSPRQEQALRSLLGDPRSYIFGLAKAVPFIPEAGLVLAGEQPFAALLLSSLAQSSRLVLPEPLPPALAIANIDPAFSSLVEAINNP